MEIGIADVDLLARGCALLGSGGGGDVKFAAAMLAQVLTRSGSVEVRRTPDVDGATITALSGAVGSPTVMLERIPGDQEFALACRTLERHVDLTLGCITPLEIGGVNGLLAVAAAARMGLPMLDADAMGRAWPRLDNLTSLGAAPLCPLVLAEPGGTVLILDGLADEGVERAVRGALPALGTWAASCLQIAPVSALGPALVQGSLTRALALGEALARGEFEAAGIDLLAEGTVMEVFRRGPRAGGVVTMQAGESVVRIDFVDEYVAVVIDGERMVCAPDVVNLLDQRTNSVVSTDRVGVGQRLRVVRVAAAPELARTERLGLQVYGVPA